MDNRKFNSSYYTREFVERDAHRETERENERIKEKGYVLYECNETYMTANIYEMY